MGIKRPEVQNCDHLYLKKDTYFEKQYRERHDQNDVLYNIQPLKFRKMTPIRK